MAEEQDKIDRWLASVAPELPPIDLEVEGIVDRISSLAKSLTRSMGETFEGFGVTHGEWHTLLDLKRRGAPYRAKPGALAARGELSSGAMTNRLDRLEEGGFVQRLPDPNDRRAVQVELTQKGHELVQDSISAQAAKEAQIVSSLNAEEQRQLNSLLRRLVLEFEREAP